MGVFGEYETVRELFRTPLCVVWLARASGILSTSEQPGSPPFVIKVLKPDLAIWDEHQTHKVTVSFIQKATLQREMGAITNHWAPIHEVGTADSAFLVTDYYESSVQRLINGRVQLSDPKLRVIVDSVLDGLTTLKERSGRAHGNLKPSNVLISGRSELEKSSIVLCDPASVDELDMARGETLDLAALGEMVCRLVLRRPAHAGAIPPWPLDDGREWRELGNTGEHWLAFCNFLLLPPMPGETRTVEQARKWLEPMPAAPPNTEVGPHRPVDWAKPKLAAAVCAALFLCVFIYASWPTKTEVAATQPGVQPVQGDWPLSRQDFLDRAGREQWITSANPALQILCKTVDDRPSIGMDELRNVAALVQPVSVLEFDPGVTAAGLPALPAPVTASIADEWRQQLGEYGRPADPDPRPAKKTEWAENQKLLQSLLGAADTPPMVTEAAHGLADAIAAASSADQPWMIRNRGSILEKIADVDRKRLELERAQREHITEDASAYVLRQRKIEFLFEGDDRWLTQELKQPWQAQIQTPWLMSRQGLLDQIEQNPQDLSSLAKRIDGLHTDYLRLTQSLHELDGALGFKSPTTLPAKFAGWQSTFEAEVDAARSTYIAATVKALPPMSPSNLPALTQYCGNHATAYKSWQIPIAGVRRSLADIHAAFDRYQLPDASIRTSLQSTRKLLSPDLAPLEPSVNELEKVVARIDSLTKSTPDQLRATGEADAPLIALAAWEQLGRISDQWPARLEDLLAEKRLQNRIETEILPMRPDLKQELGLQRGRRWSNHLRLLATGEPHAVEATVNWAATQATEIPVAASDLPIWFQFDLLLNKYKSDPAKSGQYAEFREAAKPLETSPAVKDLFARLDQSASVARLRPDTAPFALAGRRFGQSISYSALEGKISVTFIRVPSSSPEMLPFYMCTTEVSIGLFADIIGQEGAPLYANQVLTLLPRNVMNPTMNQETWVGPHGWDIDPNTLRISPRKNMWCNDFRFKNGQRNIPSPEHPIQRITPAAAMYMARLIGCRLPSKQEWQAAYAFSKAQAHADPVNSAWVMRGWKLRDPLWVAERDAAAGAGASCWLDDGIFTSPGAATHADSLAWDQPPASEHLMREGACTVEGIVPAMLADGRTNAMVKDKSVLFRSTSYNFHNCFHDLVGNVAEYVLNGESAYQAEIEVKPKDPESINQFLHRPTTELYVIGGSALSPPEMDFDKPWPLTVDQAKDGFTDVGFRLAFSDPDAKLAPKVDLAQIHYLSGDPGSSGKPPPVVKGN